MNKLAMTTAFATGCFLLLTPRIDAQVQVAPAARATAPINGKGYRGNLSKHPGQGMRVGTGKAGATTGQVPMNGMNSGMTPYGMNPYGMSPYGMNPYGMNPYGMSPYGMSPYGMNPYGMSPYGGQPGFFRGF